MTTRTRDAARAGGAEQFVGRGKRRPHRTRTVLGNVVLLPTPNSSTLICEPHTFTGTGPSGIVRLHVWHSPLCPARNGEEVAR